jgi:cytochrome c
MLLGIVLVQACSNKPSATEETKRVETGEDVAEGLRLIESNDCQTCHHIENMVAGPSYKAIATKYEVNEETIKLLSNKIINGGSGVWGDMPMNAHPALSEVEARTIVEYILSSETTKK